MKNEFKYIEKLINKNNKHKNELLSMYITRAKSSEDFLDKIINDFVELEIKTKNKKEREKIIKKRIEFCENIKNS